MKKLLRLNIFLFVMMFSVGIFAQREANVWYFGIFAGLDFNSGHPVPLTDGQINRWEGVACFSDSLGNLLMYTDGDKVWNAQHSLMPQGTGLLGSANSTESAIIIPYPQKDSLYIIFTVDAEGGDNGLCYSVVNMNLDAGLGDIETKNIKLQSPVSEKVTAVRHSNNRDFWVVSHGWETDSFFVYLVTPAGVSATPQIYELGTPHSDIGISGNNAIGYMKVSPDGTKIASVMQAIKKIDLYDFNNTTGEITNPIILYVGGSPYGVEFSVDASKLYFTSQFSLYQADLTSYNKTDILNSITEIAKSSTNNFFGAVQLATDGKIYLAQDTSLYMGIINKPSELGSNCEFNEYGLHLKGRQNRLGLPDFIQTYFMPPDFIVEHRCFGDSTIFSVENRSGIDSVLWDFGETASTNNSSDKFTAKHKYLAHGKYNVELSMWRSGVKYLKNRVVQINILPDFVGFGSDTSVCVGDSLLLVASTPDCTYFWDNSSVSDTLWAKLEKKYTVVVTDTLVKCSKTDTIFIKHLSLPEFSLGADTGFCRLDSLELKVEYDKGKYLWNTGTTDSVIFVKTAGEYWVQIADTMNCKSVDTIFVDEYNLPEFSLGNDTVICPHTEIFLSQNGYNSYLWSNLSTKNNLKIIVGGQYWLEVADNKSCRNRDTVLVEAIYKPQINLGNDTVVCNNTVFLLKFSESFTSNLWSDGSKNDYLEIVEPGNYWLQSTNICGVSIDSIKVDFRYCGEIYIPNIFTPNGDDINEYFKIKGIDDEIWSLQIINRYGHSVFKTSHYKNQWQGQDCADGTYYYVLFNRATKEKYNGFVRIYRGN